MALTKLAIMATLHCLSGCAIGEVLGSVIGSGLNWSNLATECLTIPLAFFFGYLMTMRPLLRSGLPFKRAGRIALASDTMSIVTMEIVDTAVILLVPGALAAGPGTLLFWWSLTLALFVAFIFATPVNRYLLARGKGHAIVHEYHH
ncbi:MAG TPA: DUF4396 domain-containing protein [Candidatus Saccharimonadales bacterium]|nr:DUF4396 domain-containing protein [Candidatus Saccharimonadales bacterium]